MPQQPVDVMVAWLDAIRDGDGDTGGQEEEDARQVLHAADSTKGTLDGVLRHVCGLNDDAETFDLRTLVRQLLRFQARPSTIPSPMSSMCREVLEEWKDEKQNMFDEAEASFGMAASEQERRLAQAGRPASPLDAAPHAEAPPAEAPPAKATPAEAPPRTTSPRRSARLRSIKDQKKRQEAELTKRMKRNEDAAVRAQQQRWAARLRIEQGHAPEVDTRLVNGQVLFKHGDAGPDETQYYEKLFDDER